MLATKTLALPAHPCQQTQILPFCIFWEIFCLPILAREYLLLITFPRLQKLLLSFFNFRSFFEIAQAKTICLKFFLNNRIKRKSLIKILLLRIRLCLE